MLPEFAKNRGGIRLLKDTLALPTYGSGNQLKVWETGAGAERSSAIPDMGGSVWMPWQGVVVSFGSATGVPPVNGHGQDGRATPNDTTTWQG